MNSKEIVRRTFEFSNPERVAHSFYPSDFIWSGVHMAAPQNQWKRMEEKEWSRTDEWGNVWKRRSGLSRGKIVHGGLQSLDNIDNFQFPDFSNPLLYNSLKAVFSQAPDKWHIALLSGSTYEIANALLDHYLSAMFTSVQKIRVLHDKIDQILRTEILHFKEAGADSVMIIEDLADTFNVPMGPSLWRDEFKPRLKGLCDYAHDLDLIVIMHSLQESEFVTDFVMTGVDCIELDCPQSFGIDALEALQQQFSVTFWCPVDIHTTLQTQNEATIRNDAREMLDRLWKGQGGFIAGYYWDNQGLGLSPDYQDYACDEFLRSGKAEKYQNINRVH